MLDRSAALRADSTLASGESPAHPLHGRPRLGHLAPHPERVTSPRHSVSRPKKQPRSLRLHSPHSVEVRR